MSIQYNSSLFFCYYLGSFSPALRCEWSHGKPKGFFEWKISTWSWMSFPVVFVRVRRISRRQRFNWNWAHGNLDSYVYNLIWTMNWKWSMYVFLIIIFVDYYNKRLLPLLNISVCHHVELQTVFSIIIILTCANISFCKFGFTVIHCTKVERNFNVFLLVKQPYHYCSKRHCSKNCPPNIRMQNSQEFEQVLIKGLNKMLAPHSWTGKKFSI